MSLKNGSLGLKDYSYRKDAICIFCNFLSLFYLNHKIAQIKRIVSLALGIYICEIRYICGYIFSNTDNTDLRDVSLALGMSICESTIYFISNTDSTDSRDYIAYARDEYLCGLYFTFRSYSRPSAAPKLKRRATLYPVAFR